MEFMMAASDQDDIVIKHSLAIWESYGTPLDHFEADPAAKVRGFIEEGRERRELTTFFAMDGTIPAGSVSCQVHLSPYPDVLKPGVHKRGYIWSVFVEPDYQCQGISKRLTQLAVEYLRAIGCTAVILHSSDAGGLVYRSLGFEPTKEMRLSFN